MIKSAFKFGLIGLAGATLMGCSDGTAQENIKEINSQADSTEYVAQIINDSLLPCEAYECEFYLTTEVIDETNKLSYRNQPGLNVIPILNAVEAVGSTRFERLHNVSENVMFKLDKDVIKHLPEFENVWLYNPKSLSAAGPKPTLEILPYYYRLTFEDNSYLFVGTYSKTANGFALDMSTMDSHGRYIRVSSAGDGAAQDALSKISQDCDPICQILRGGLDDAKSKTPITVPSTITAMTEVRFDELYCSKNGAADNVEITLINGTNFFIPRLWLSSLKVLGSDAQATNNAAFVNVLQTVWKLPEGTDKNDCSNGTPIKTLSSGAETQLREQNLNPFIPAYSPIYAFSDVSDIEFFKYFEVENNQCTRGEDLLIPLRLRKSYPKEYKGQFIGNANSIKVDTRYVPQLVEMGIICVKGKITRSFYDVYFTPAIGVEINTYVYHSKNLYSVFKDTIETDEDNNFIPQDIWPNYDMRIIHRKILSISEIIDEN